MATSRFLNYFNRGGNQNVQQQQSLPSQITINIGGEEFNLDTQLARNRSEFLKNVIDNPNNPNHELFLNEQSIDLGINLGDNYVFSDFITNAIEIVFNQMSPPVDFCEQNTLGDDKIIYYIADVLQSKQLKTLITNCTNKLSVDEAILNKNKYEIESFNNRNERDRHRRFLDTFDTPIMNFITENVVIYGEPNEINTIIDVIVDTFHDVEYFEYIKERVILDIFEYSVKEGFMGSWHGVWNYIPINMNLQTHMIPSKPVWKSNNLGDIRLLFELRGNEEEIKTAIPYGVLIVKYNSNTNKNTITFIRPTAGGFIGTIRGVAGITTTVTSTNSQINEYFISNTILQQLGINSNTIYVLAPLSIENLQQYEDPLNFIDFGQDLYKSLGRKDGEWDGLMYEAGIQGFNIRDLFDQNQLQEIPGYEQQLQQEEEYYEEEPVVDIDYTSEREEEESPQENENYKPEKEEEYEPFGWD